MANSAFVIELSIYPEAHTTPTFFSIIFLLLDRMRLILLLLLLLPTIAFPQKVGDLNLSDHPEIQYLDIYSQPKVFSNKLLIAVNYGQEAKDLENSERVKDDDGKDYPFNNLTDALNKFYGWGWELVALYSESGKLGNYTHAVLKRRTKQP